VLIISNKINYPPKELISPSGAEKKDFEYIILWMLNNNEECNWSIFLEKPLEISLATLSKYMNLLMRDGFVNKISKGLYKITLEGKKKYFDLRYKDSIGKDLKYPPDLIYKKRNYSHIILWMLYNNDSCKWGDFLEKPLSINSHSLSKNINQLIKEGCVEINESNYNLTKVGEKQYNKILKIYNLDYQSILDEELRKIGRVREDLEDFFNKWEIVDEELKIIFLDLLNKIDYLKMKEVISSKEEFHKIILFFSLNNVKRYPEYISILNFSESYKINQTALDFFLQKILEEKLFPFQFFEFIVNKNQRYYFRAGEKIERTINLIIDETIKEYSFLNLLELKSSSEERKNHSITMFKNIINEVSANIFNKVLKFQLINFLPGYIKYLYNNLKKDIPSNLDEKIKILAFQDILNLCDTDIDKIRRDLYQLTPILRNFPRYKIFNEIKKKIEDSNFE
jgi:Mn-dependent DtxR family transcriptional regulator